MTTPPFRMNERDLDLILLEELFSDSGFADWMAKQIGIEGSRFIAAEHSVFAKANGKGGETDVLAYFKRDGKTIAVLIEDKIAAQFADKQAARYQERAADIVTANRADSKIVILCAPQGYLDGVPKDDPWDEVLPLEAVAKWFEARGNFRGDWRAKALRSCLGRLSRNSSAGSEDVRRFSKALKAYLNALGEDFDHAVISKNSWFIIRSSQTPADVEIGWKNGKGRVDLTFSGQHVGKAKFVTAPPGVIRTLAEGTNRKCDVFGIEVPTADITADFDSQLDVIEEVMSAARALLPLVQKVLGKS